MKNSKLSKAELIELAKKHGYFKKEAVKEIWARQNGHFYYNKPPAFVDGLESYKITREDVEGETVEYPLNGKDTSAVIEGCKTQEELDALITEGKLLENDARKGVLKALDKKKEELSPKGE